MDLERYPTVDPDLFRPVSDASAQKRLFTAFVRNITLELFDYCNRQCSYCPISLIDRRSAVNLMPEPVLDRILNDLEAVDFNGAICLNLFNEPLAHERTEQAAAELSAALPNARIWLNTNGDYLKRPLLERLEAAGLKRMVVTLHVAADNSYDDKRQITRLSQLSARTGVTFVVERFRPGLDLRASGHFKGLEITVKSVNYDEHGVNRGGAMEHIPVLDHREAPCNRPFHDLTIAWNGNVYPCCQFVEGFEPHRDFIVGNIANAASLYALYCHPMMASFRRDTFGYGPKRLPCDTCADQSKCRGAADRTLRETYASLTKEPVTVAG